MADGKGRDRSESPPKKDEENEQSSENVSIQVENEEDMIGSKSSFTGTQEPGIPTKLSQKAFPAYADMVEMEAVKRLSKSRVEASHIIELVKSRDLTKFYEAKEKLEHDHQTSGKTKIAEIPLEELMEKYCLEDVTQGLSDSQVVFNRKLYGNNMLDLGKKDPLWKIFLSQFKSFVIPLLFIASIASFALRNYVEGAFIIFIVTLNAIMASYMEVSAANVLEKLAQLSSPTAKVVRNGVETEVPSVDVVLGDVLVLRTGDTVVADTRLFEEIEMRVNESLLTGESLDVKKTTEIEDTDNPFSPNMCFASTSVVSGFGRGVVVKTGMDTQVGKIAKQLKKASEGPKLTPLQRGLNRLGGTIGIISTVVLVTIVIVAIIMKYDDPTIPNTNRTLSIVLLAVGFAASSIPEGLPMVVTISLSLGAKDMARENANVLKLPAVETLGCCSVVCSDKTGTLTEGKMVTTDLVLFYSKNNNNNNKNNNNNNSNNNNTTTRGSKDNKSSKNRTKGDYDDDDQLMGDVDLGYINVKFYPTFGFNPRGGVFYPKELNEKLKEKLIANFKKEVDFKSLKENVLYEPSEAAEEEKDEGKRYKKERDMVLVTMSAGYLNSHNTNLTKDENNRWMCLGNMTESPLVVASQKCGLTTQLYQEYERLERLEVPFNSKRKMSITVHRLKSKNQFRELNLERKGKVYTHVALIKGAPDVLRPYCRYMVKEQDDVGSVTGKQGEQGKEKGWCVDYEKKIKALNREGGEQGQQQAEQQGQGPGHPGEELEDPIMAMNDKLSKNSLRVIMMGLVPLSEEDVQFLSKLEDSDYRQAYILYGQKEFKEESSELKTLTIQPSFGNVNNNNNNSNNNNSNNNSSNNSNPTSSNKDNKTTSSTSTTNFRKLVGLNGKVVLLGLTGSFDPPRPGVKEAVETCRTAGVRVIMITGDQKTTAVAIAKQINLIQSYRITSSRVIYTGEVGSKIRETEVLNLDMANERFRSLANTSPSNLERSEYMQEMLEDDELGLECSGLHLNNNPNMDYLPDEQIDEITTKYNVFCRAQPEDKVVIVNSLKRKGLITAMTGDGVNDAAALKTADIGISMGLNGTEVAKGASELVLLDDNFCTIVKAVKAGRTIYSNIQKFVSFLLGTNIGEILYLTTSIVISTLPPVEALQILILNFLTDGCPAVALSREPADEEAMKRPPRKPKSPIMTKEWWLFGNLPHTIFEALMVIASILIGLYICTGVVRVPDINKMCKYVTLKDKGGKEVNAVYFCKSYEYLITRNYTGWVTNIDYYDYEEQKMVTFLGACKGRPKELKTTDENLHPKLKQKFQGFTLEKLINNASMYIYVTQDENGWIMSTSDQVVESDKHPYGAGPAGYSDIVSRKSRQARTISFITAVWSEMLRAYTVRSWEFFYKVFNRNPWMHVACSVSATFTFALTVIPGVSSILRVVSLSYWQYILAVLLSVMTLVLDECVSKPLYHHYDNRKRLKHNQSI